MQDSSANVFLGLLILWSVNLGLPFKTYRIEGDLFTYEFIT